MMNVPAVHAHIIMACNILPAILAITGNIVFLVTLYKTATLHTPSNILIGALCLSDLFVGLIVQPLFMTNLYWEQTCYPSHLLTTIYYYTYVLFSGLSLLSAGCLAIDRYIAVSHPFRYTQKVTCRTYIIAAIVFSAFWAICSLSIFLGIYEYWTLFFVIEIIVLSTIVLCYARIYFIILQLKRNVVTTVGTIATVSHAASSASQDGIAQQRRRENERSCTIAIILGFFLVSYSVELARSLHYVSLGNNKHCEDSDIVFVLDVWTDFLVLANSCVNPIVYCVRSTEIRDAARRVFKIRRNSRVGGSVGSSVRARASQGNGNINNIDNIIINDMSCVRDNKSVMESRPGL
eukprot:gene130-741_t